MRSIASTLIILLVAVGAAYGENHARDIDVGLVWVDHSPLGYNAGDTLLMNNSDTEAAIVQMRDAAGGIILAGVVPGLASNSTPIPIGTHRICIAATDDCFPAGLAPVPSLGTNGVVALTLVMVGVGLWLYRGRKKTAKLAM